MVTPEEWQRMVAKTVRMPDFQAMLGPLSRTWSADLLKAATGLEGISGLDTAALQAKVAALHGITSSDLAKMKAGVVAGSLGGLTDGGLAKMKADLAGITTLSMSSGALAKMAGIGSLGLRPIFDMKTDLGQAATNALRLGTINDVSAATIAAMSAALAGVAASTHLQRERHVQLGRLDVERTAVEALRSGEPAGLERLDALQPPQPKERSGEPVTPPP